MNDQDDLKALDGYSGDLSEDENDLAALDQEIASQKAKEQTLFNMFNLAPLGMRMIAFIGDLVLPVFVFYFIAILVGLDNHMFTLTVDDFGREVKQMTETGGLIFVLGIFISYFFVQLPFAFGKRQTLFKWLFRLQVVRIDGYRPTLLHYLTRQMLNIALSLNPFYLMGPMYAVLDATVIFSEKNRCLHDRWSRTIVVKREFLDPSERN